MGLRVNRLALDDGTSLQVGKLEMICVCKNTWLYLCIVAVSFLV